MSGEVARQSPSDLHGLRSLGPGAMSEEIPGAGHCQMVTAPERLNAPLDRFSP